MGRIVDENYEPVYDDALVDLYNFVGDRIIEFCDKTYYGDIVCSFEQSYDGKEWTKEVEFATFYYGTNLCYKNLWNDGQTYIQNLRIWHLDDSEPVVRCKDCKFYNPHFRECAGFGRWFGLENEWGDNDFCSKGEQKDEAEIDIDENWYSDEYHRIGENEKDDI